MGEKINLLLLGTTGQGKSATGNFLLDRKTFRTSACCAPTAQTNQVDYSFGTFDDLKLLVVDSPGFENTKMDSYEDKKSAAKNMSQALAMCYGGIDSFIYVLRFGNKFTAEERCAIEALKQIFGPKYLDHVIVVLTCGDVFEKMKENDELNITFKDWCEQQTGDFHQLYIECQRRFVLFDNYEKNPEKKRAHIDGLVELAQEIKQNKGRYTRKEKVKRKCEKMIVKAHAPELKKKIQRKVSQLNSDIEKYAKAPTDTEKERITKAIVDLKEEIKKKDDGHGVLCEILQLVEKVSERLQDVEDKRTQCNVM